MKPKSIHFILTSAIVVNLSNPLSAVEIQKADNTDNLNLTSSWVGVSAVPGGSDVAVWDSTVTGANTSNLGANASWAGMKITNPAGAVGLTGGTRTLTLGISGLNMSSATQDLSLANTYTRLGGSASWTVQSGRILTVNGAMTLVAGTTTLTLDGAGTYTFNGNFSNGTAGYYLKITGGGTVNLNGSGSFQGGSSGGVLLSSGTINLGNDLGLDGVRFDWTSGTVSAAGGARSTSVPTRLTGGGAIAAGSNDLTFSGGFTPCTSGSYTLVNNVSGAMLTFSGPVGISGTSANRTFYLAGDGNTTISGDISNGSSSTASGIDKSGAGTLTLAGTNSYGGATNVAGGTVELGSTGSITASSSLTVQGSGNYTFFNNGGSATFTGAVATGVNSNNSPLVKVVNGSFHAGSVAIDRCGGGLSSEPTQGSTTAGFYVSGTSTVQIDGTLSVNGSNSTGSARFDGGTVDVGGAVTIGLGNTTRWSVLDVNGATFTSTDAATGIRIGSASEGNAIFLVRNGTATVEKITFNKPGAAVLQGVARVNGGALYVGSGGIVTTGSNPDFSTTLKLAGGTLGATANWTSPADVGVQLTAPATIKAADSLGTGHDIELAGPVSGSSGGIVKEGSGKLTLGGTNTYTGATTITGGTLAIASTGSLGATAVEVQSSGTLTGTGALGGAVTVRSGGHLAYAVAATQEAQVPQAITGLLTLDSGTIVDLSAASTPAAGVYVLATATGGISGTPTVVNQPGVSGTVSVDTASSPNRLLLTVSAADPFTAWIDATWPTLSDKTPAGDPDHDGIPNLLEFVLNGNPSTSDSSILPQLVVTSTAFEFTFARRDDSLPPETTQTFQYGSDLSGWTDVVIPATGGTVGAATITVTDGSPADTVKVSILKTAAVGNKLFGRLKVTK